MGTIVTTLIQTVEHYFMQFSTKTRGESKKSTINVTINYTQVFYIRPLHHILFISYWFNS